MEERMMEEMLEKTGKLAENVMDEIRREEIQMQLKSKNGNGLPIPDMAGGKLILLGGATSIGKTSFALSLVEQIGVEEGRPCVYFSTFDDKKVMKGLMETMNGVRFKGAEWIKNNGIREAVDAAERIKSSPVVIEGLDDNYRDRISGICMGIDNPGLVVIDQIQGLFPGGKYYDGNKEIMRGFIRDMRELARKICCPVIVITSLMSTWSTREEHRPILQDFEEMGFNLDDVDMILGLHRDSYYADPSSWENGAEILILKGGDDEEVTINMAYDPRKGMFVDDEALLEKKKKEFEERALELEKELFEQRIKEERLLIEEMEEKLEEEVLSLRCHHVISMEDVEKRLELQETWLELEELIKKTIKLERKYDMLRRRK